MATDVYGHAVRSLAGRNHIQSHQVPKTSRQWQVQDFNHRVKMLLTKADRQYLHAVLGEYQLYQQIDKLVLCLKSVLDTPAKLDLLRDLRHFIPSEHVSRYDALAPYHKMAHMWRPPGVTGSLNRPPKTKRKSGQGPASMPTTPQLKAKVLYGTQGAAEILADNPADLKVVTLVKGQEDPLGFSIRGGSEHGLGIFISEIEAGTAAEQCGLNLGDNVIEVNSVSFENIASSSAVKVLTGSNRLKMIIRRVGKIPGFRSAKEKTAWYDIEEGGIIEGVFEDHRAYHYPPGVGHHDAILERRINLFCGREGQYLGFNIRGGCEYGLGIYISRVDGGGLAEQKGLKVGDQIVEVNDLSYENISHVSAVEYMRTHRQLMMTVRDIGKFPAYKEIFAEYRWIDTATGTVSKTRTYQKQLFGSTVHIRSIPVRASPPSPSVDEEISRETIRQFPMDSRVESYAQTDNDDSEDEVFNLPAEYTRTVTNRLSQDYTAGLGDQDPLLIHRELNNGPTPEFFEIPVVKTDSHVDPDDYEDFIRKEYGDVVFSAEPRETRFPKSQSHPDTLLPKSSDVMLRERPPVEDNVGSTKVKGQGRHKDKSPKSTIAVRAMEMETRKKYPELALEFDSRERRMEVPHKGKSKDDLELAVKDNNKFRTFKEKLFGSKSRARFKSATHGGSRSKDRKALSNINFSDEYNRNSAAGHSRSSKVTTSSRSSTWSEVEAKAGTVLNEDEVVAVHRHLSRYEKEQELDDLMTPLLAILDTTEKMTLLELIRPNIANKDKPGFDDAVQQQREKLDKQVVKNRTTRTQAAMKQRHSSDSSYTSEAIDKYKRLKRPSADRGRIAPLDFSSQTVEDEQKIVPGPPDAQHNLEIHRPRSSSKVYKAIVLPGTHQVDLLTNGQQGEPIGGARAEEEGEEEENLVNLSKESSPQLAQQSSSLTGTVESMTVPIYATVDKSKKTSSRAETHRRYSREEHNVYETLNETQLSNSQEVARPLTASLTPVDSELSATESERQNPSLIREIQDIPDSAFPSRQATLSLFDGLLAEADDDDDDDEDGEESEEDGDDTDEEGHGQFSATFRPTISPILLETTSVTSAHWGSYDVNPASEQQLDNRADTPVFFAPPPPMSPPPSDLSSRQGPYGAATSPDPAVPTSSSARGSVSSSGYSLGGGRQQQLMNYLTVSTDSFEGSSIPPSPRDESRKLRMGDKQINTITFANDTIQDTRVEIEGSPEPAADGQVNQAIDDPEVDSFFDVNLAARIEVVEPPVEVIRVQRPGVTVTAAAAPSFELNAQPLTPPAEFSATVLLPGDSQAAQVAPSSEEEEDEDEGEEEEVGILRVTLDKTNKSLGISISGGRDSRTQPEIRIQNIFPSGAAALEGTLESGMQILSIDGNSLEGASHSEAVDIIRKSYGNKRQRNMNLIVLPVPRKSWDL